MQPAHPRRGLRALLALAALLPVVVALARPWDDALFRGAAHGADWLEHAERLRSLERWRLGEQRPWAFVLSLDSVYPPGQMLWGMLAGGVLGHSDVAVLRANVLWWALISAAAGVVAARLLDGRTGWAAAAIVAGLPAVTGLGTVFHSDLPVFSLLWAATAWMAWAQDRRPAWAATGTALLVLCALSFKWSAGPWAVLLVPLSLLAPQPSWRRRAIALGSAAVLVALGTDAFLRQSTTSLSQLASLTYRTPLSLQPGGLLGVARELLAFLDAASQAQPRHPPSSDRWIVPFRLVVSALSPVLAGGLAVAAVGGAWRRPRVAALAIGALVGGLFLAPALLHLPDDRFAVAALPGLAIAAAGGWSRLPRRWALAVAGLWAVVAGAVSWDFHHGRQAYMERDALAQAWELPDHFRWRGLGADSSLDGAKGWMHQRPRGHDGFLPGKQEAWRAVQACDAADLVIHGLDPMLDGPWFEYRNRLDSLEGAGARRLHFDEGPSRAAHLWVRAQGEGEPALRVDCAGPPGG